MARIEKALASEDCSHGCSLFLVDVDNFKQVNDGFGHPEGDRVLKEIAAFLGRNMRKDDVVARLGGDEFAVFAAGLVPGPALERVLAQLSGGIYARNPRPADMPEDLQPSISIGAVVCTRTSVTFDDLYQVADEALYVAKRGGKSQAAYGVSTNAGFSVSMTMARLSPCLRNSAGPSSFERDELAYGVERVLGLALGERRLHLVEVVRFDAQGRGAVVAQGARYVLAIALRINLGGFALHQGLTLDFQ